MTVLDRLRAAYERHQSELVDALTLDGMQHEIERGGPDEATMRRIRRRFLDRTNSKTPNLERAAA